MKITVNWLRELVEVVLPADELADALVMAGIDVESVEEHRVIWRSVEIAEIASVVPHPNADRLRLCEVRTGRETVRVVCGASNMQAGDRVALAPPGTALPDGRRIERATIRGQASHGMLCSARELAFADDDAGGILILPRDAPVGSALVEYLGAEDTVLDLAPTPNRGDCLSVLGIAREVAALTGARLHVPASHVLEDEPAAAALARVEVDAPDLCPRYCARIMRGVQVGPTPPWMRTRLALVGLRSINNVVDVTNYVMLERGQPLHAFDLARITGARVVVRRAGSREKVVTLDGLERELAPDDLVIADAESPIAVAGVIGGASSEIRPETRDVLLESAFFVPQTVRRTARRLGLATDSSFRFERGVDPAGTAAALDRAVELLLAGAGGTVARGMLERHAGRGRRTPPIRLRPARLNALLGTRLGSAEIERPLRALGAEIAGSSKTHVRVVPPSHRFDLQAEVDLIEEVARLAGYDTIPASMPAVAVGGPGPGVQRDIEERARATLRAAGLSEMVTLALIASAENRLFPGLPEMAGDPVPLRNPLSADADELRRSLLPGLLHVLEENRRHGESLVGGFSLGRVYARSGSQYHERQALALLIAGTWPPATVGEAARPSSFADIKGALDLLLARLHLDAVRWEALAGEAAYLHPGKSARITIGSVLCGVAGALHPDLVAERGLMGEVWVAELDMLRVVQYCPRRVNFRVLPRFPAVQRDIAVVVAMDFQAQRVLDAIAASGEPLVEDARIFDQYTGAPIPDGKKSLAYAISYRAADRTLTDEEVNAVHERIVGTLLERLPVEVRR
jgi:phenylalanyl-tRNA synthetase beta chain